MRCISETDEVYFWKWCSLFFRLMRCNFRVEKGWFFTLSGTLCNSTYYGGSCNMALWGVCKFMMLQLQVHDVANPLLGCIEYQRIMRRAKNKHFRTVLGWCLHRCPRGFPPPYLGALTEEYQNKSAPKRLFSGEKVLSSGSWRLFLRPQQAAAPAGEPWAKRTEGRMVSPRISDI